MNYTIGNMVGRVGLIILSLLAACWACDARDLVATTLLNRESEVSDVSALQINHKDSETDLKVSEGVGRNENVCMLCEEFAAEALNYLSQNKTQTEIIFILHKSCSKLYSLKEQCNVLVDYYAPLFFLEISSTKPDDFCQKINLCEEVVSYSRQLSNNSCAVCQNAVAEVLLKLKDPDTQLDIVELLLKGCGAVKNYEKKCKRMVREYAPFILVNAEQFLETTDICTMLHACDSPAAITQGGQALPNERALSSSY